MKLSYSSLLNGRDDVVEGVGDLLGELLMSLSVLLLEIIE